MGLSLYFDAGATQLISAANPDTATILIPEPGQNGSDERQIWMASDDTDLTYSDIVIQSVGENTTVVVDYAADVAGSPGSYSSTMEPTDGDYETAMPLWRRIRVFNVTAAFIWDAARHRITADEEVA